ncbi:S49 family peptidase [Halopiger xanaduensis]|uniref:Peptidase S49 n=1 Tax=Halopiger xanaduensis (strain DSM 18323 / JCM 14033 / SH-6) TaxID=797210 RepID=F8D4J6_HALXS|nr:S49 family peptidase [Halopiger xanaduensis]AEH36324.1 peptidase S49 [Halopiger xanaduensis SH-6]
MSGTTSTIRDALGTVARSYVTVVVVALLVGAAVAPMAWGATSSPDGTVAVIEMDRSITESVADGVTDDLREARENESIDAVVLQVDSPGGGVTASESLYLAVDRTAEEMPVVANVQSTGASGGYYMIAPSDEIYVSPSSTVGSIGVRATYTDMPMSEGMIATGPDKVGSNEAEIKRQVEKMKQTFIGSVMEHRGDDLELSETELSYAKTYTGMESVENGLADEIGDRDVAIGSAAERAGLEDYEVVEMERDSLSSGVILLEDGTKVERSHEQTFGEYGDVNTPAFLALWGTVEGENIVETSQPTDADATTATAAQPAGAEANTTTDNTAAQHGGEGA